MNKLNKNQGKNKHSKANGIMINPKIIVGFLLFAILLDSSIPLPAASADVSFNSVINVSNDNTDSLQSQLAASGSNTYVVWRNNTLSSGSSLQITASSEIYVKSSTNSGTSFGSSIDLSNTAGDTSVKIDTSHPVGTSQTPAINATGSKLYVTWEETINSGGTAKDAIYFTNGTNGANFGGPFNLRSTSLSGLSQSPQIASSQGNVYVAWKDTSVSNGDIFFANSTDDGKTFHTAKNISNDASYASNSPEVAGVGANVYVTWRNGTSPNDNVLYTRSTDNGKTFVSPLQLGTVNGSATTPLIVAGGSNVYVAWANGTSPSTSIYFRSSTDSGVTFNSKIKLGNFGYSTTPNPQIAVSGNNVYVTWENKTSSSANSDVVFVKSTDNGASFSTPVNLSSNSGTSQTPAITAHGNNVYVSWTDNTSDSSHSETLLKASPDQGSTFCSVNNLSNNGDDSTTPALASSGNNVYTIWRDVPSASTLGDIKFRGGTATSSCVVQFDTSQYRLSDTATITITDSGSDTSGSADTVSATITSNTDSTGISLTLTETGAHTGVFTGTVKFTTGSSSSASKLLSASAGDTITATYQGLTGTASIYSRSISFDFSQYTLNDKAHITVTDQNSNLDASTRETISLKITSNADSSGFSLVLKETGVNTGIFDSDTLIFMQGNYLIDTDKKITISQSETDNSQVTAGSPRTLTTLNVKSDSDTTGFNPTLTEGSPNSGSFSGDVSFTTGSTGNGALKVTGGDILTIAYRGAQALGIMLPNTNSSVGGIQVSTTSSACSSCVTASFQGKSTSISITPGSGGGGGGGGLVRPGLVLDVLASVTGGSTSIPPSFSLASLAAVPGSLPDNIRQEVLHQDPNKPLEPQHDSFDYPLSIDGGGYLLGRYTNKISTVIEKTNTPVDLKLNLPATNLQHLALYTNLHGTENDLTKSDTYIIYDKDSQLKIVDPHHYFDHVKFDLTTEGVKNKIDYSITFANPMDKSNIVLRAWNDRHSSNDVVVLDAWQAVDTQKLTSSSELSPLQETQIQTPTANSPLASPAESKVPSWVKNNAKLWNAGSIQDSEFETGIQYLISEKIISIQKQTVEPSESGAIPKWVKNTAGFWANGDVTEDEFLHSIEYLVKLGLIKVS